MNHCLSLPSHCPCVPCRSTVFSLPFHCRFLLFHTLVFASVFTAFPCRFTAFSLCPFCESLPLPCVFKAFQCLKWRIFLNRHREIPWSG